MAKRRSRKLLAADQFQARVILLLRVAHADWNEWEQDWLLDEARRHPRLTMLGEPRPLRFGDAGELLMEPA